MPWLPAAIQGTQAMVSMYTEKRAREKNEKMAKEYQAAMEEYNKQQMAMFGEAKRKLAEQKALVIKTYEKMTKQAVADQIRSTKEQMAGYKQQVVSRGLQASAVLPNTLAGVQQQGTEAQRRVKDEYNIMLKNDLGQATSAEIALLASKNDVSPDYGQMAGLASQSGQAQAAMMQFGQYAPQMIDAYKNNRGTGNYDQYGQPAGTNYYNPVTRGSQSWGSQPMSYYQDAPPTQYSYSAPTSVGSSQNYYSAQMQPQYSPAVQ